MRIENFVRSYVRPFIPFPKKRTLLRYFPSFETKNIAHIFRLHRIDTVLDVGANRGQFGERIRSGGYKGKVISFEPNIDAHKMLLHASRRDPNWLVAEPFALGDADGSAILEIPADSALGSMRSLIHPQHVKHQPTTVRRLDDVMNDLEILKESNIALKIDVQGLEDKVLDGAKICLSRAKVILIEVSLQPVYIDEPSYLDILGRLKDCGFDAVFFSSVTSQKLYGESWQVDVLLVRG